MEQLYNQDVVNDQHTRPQLRRGDWLILTLATVIMVFVTWHKTQPVPVLPKPQSTEVLRFFCQP